MSPVANIPLPAKPYLDNCEWIQTHLDELVRQYSDQWVAVDQGKVLAADPDLGKVSAAVRQATSCEHVAYEFIAGASTIF